MDEEHMAFDAHQQPGAVERPSLRQFAALVPRQPMSRSGAVFYSGRDAFGEPAPAYLLGLNPGGDPSRGDGITIGSDTEWVLQFAPASRSRYRDESWMATEPGTWGMQPRVLHLLRQLNLDPGRVPSSNLVFPRSRQEHAITGELPQLVEACWPFHQAVIETLAVPVVICFGVTVAGYVRGKFRAHTEIDSFVEANSRRWTSHTYRAASGVRVVQLTHPSRADWRNPASDPTELVRTALRE